MSTLPVDDTRPRNRRDTRRLPLIALMAGSLVAASVWRSVILSNPFWGQKTEASIASGGANIGQFNSYTLGLLLGGLRGPLVMTLWSSSETQKGDRNLEDINTKIELIRLLQPEFDAVHLFQIWNKAYNLSVQMSNLASKYATILDALAYADSAREGKANINLEATVGSIYFDKLGSSSEKTYYRQRVREETRAPSGQTQIVFPESRRDEFVKAALAVGADQRHYTIRPYSGQAGRLSVRLRDEFATPILASFKGSDIETTHTDPVQRQATAKLSTTLRGALSPLLDPSGKLLPAAADRDSIAAGKAAGAKDSDWRPEDGEYAYLVRFEPYPYGVSPYALGYNYYKRSVALQESKKQTHAQLSDRVISSRPALSLKAWAEEEVELGRLAEMAQFGLVPQKEGESPLPMEMPAANIPIDPTPLTPLLKEAIYNYAHAAELGDRATAEFSEHIARYRDDMGTYTSQLADIAGKSALARADAIYLQLITTTDPAARAALAKEAALRYRKAIDLVSRNILAFYVPDTIIASTFPKGYAKLDVMNSFDNPGAFPAELVDPTMRRAFDAMIAAQEQPGPEVAEYQTYAGRAGARLQKVMPLVK